MILSKKLNFSFITAEYLFPKAIVFVQEHFGKIKPDNNMPWFVKGDSL